MFRIFLLLLMFTLTSHAVKRKLNNNSTVTFLETPKEVESLAEVLTEGELYGRFRLNSFSFDWVLRSIEPSC